MNAVTKVEASSGFDLIREYAVVNEGQTGNDLDHLFTWLKESYEAAPVLFWAVVLNKGNNFNGYFIGYAPAGADYTYVVDVWADARHVTQNEVDDIFLKFAAWSREIMGRQSIRTETQRNPEAFKRRWGFEIRGYVLDADVDEVQKKLWTSRDKRKDHDEWIFRNNDAERTTLDLGAEETGEPTLFEAPEQSGHTGDSVRGGESGSPDTGAASSEAELERIVQLQREPVSE